MNGITGPRCIVEASTTWRISQVHEVLCEKLDIPADWQTLIKETSPLRREVTVGSLITDQLAAALQLTLVVEEAAGALLAAIEREDVAAALCLLRQRRLPDLNDVLPYGESVLHRAISRGLSDVALQIVARGDFLLINAKDYVFGWTALHVAAVRGALPVCRAILGRADCAVALALLKDKTAAQWARSCGHLAAAVFIESAEAAAEIEPGALRTALSKGEEAFALKLVQRPRVAGLNDLNEHGSTVLDLALKRGFVDVALAILARQDFTQVNHRNDWGSTALHQASQRGDLTLCQAILARADFRELMAVNVSGRTAQQEAHHCSKDAVAELLRTAETRLLR